ncbi:dihydropteroate synthase [Herbivorax sp. ANBcel31]|uniref:dihydropteroate synthase n=1 Tax=Herbivorax sp. ANBcel31 TaxID=3069754 RepID=UPI0027B1EB05|nr:dihydropteroate synthase [Herbivorax sp. ANBcel31]MDQ2085006.1 dihydropteroate synthase [Herbivorax sp. ANBcel31]
MIVVGEKINADLKSIKAALDKNNKEIIQELAKKQQEAGASYIDINTGVFKENEVSKLKWLVDVVQEVTDVPFSIDSSNAEAIEAALKANKNGKPVINSITAEKEKYNKILPLVLEYDAYVIALCMDNNGMPETVDERIVIADKLVNSLLKEGVKIDDILLDPLVRPVGSGTNYGVCAIEAIKKLKAQFPKVKVICGINNISFGVPARKLMNQSFLVAAMISGLDAAIMDSMDKKLMSTIFATEALMGKDEFCMNYQMKFREGLLEI